MAIKNFQLDSATDFNKEKLPIKTVDGYSPDASGNIDTKRLPLSGGTMTGPIRATYGAPIIGANNAMRLVFCAGVDFTKGAYVSLDGCEVDETQSLKKGRFSIVANDGTNQGSLVGYPNGYLSWQGANIVRSVNGLNADDTGAVIVPVAPDYSAGVSMSSGFTAPSNGVCVLAWMGNPGQYKSASIDGVTMFNDSYSSGQVGQSHAVLIVAKGNVVTFSVTGSESTYTFFPFK